MLNKLQKKKMLSLRKEIVCRWETIYRAALAAGYLGDERADLVLDLHESAEAPLHNGGEVEEAQGVTRGGGVKDHHWEIHPLY